MEDHTEADDGATGPVRYRRPALEAELAALPTGTGLAFRATVAAAQEPETIVHGIRRLLRAGDHMGAQTLTDLLIEKAAPILEIKARRQFPQSPDDQKDVYQDATIQLWHEVADTSAKEEFWEFNFKVMLSRAVSDAATRIRRQRKKEQLFHRDECDGGVDEESMVADERFTGDEQDPFHCDLITEEALAILGGNVRMTAYLLLRGVHMTKVAEILNVSDRTIRTYVQQAVQQITEWSQQRS